MTIVIIFFQTFIVNPRLVASCLSAGDDQKLDAVLDVVCTTMTCCYGNNFITNDYCHLLEVCYFVLVMLF